MNSLKYKTPFIYKLSSKYYVLGFHVAAPYTSPKGIEAYEDYAVKQDKKSFARVMDFASVVPQTGDVDRFLKSLSEEELDVIRSQYRAYLQFEI